MELVASAGLPISFEGHVPSPGWWKLGSATREGTSVPARVGRSLGGSLCPSSGKVDLCRVSLNLDF
jgi:hypothetical protein